MKTENHETVFTFRQTDTHTFLRYTGYSQMILQVLVHFDVYVRIISSLYLISTHHIKVYIQYLIN